MLYVILILILVSAYLIGKYFYESKPHVSFVLPAQEMSEDYEPKNKTHLFKRLLNPFIPLAKFLTKKPYFNKEKFSQRLVMAGSPLRLPEFIAVKILSLLFFMIIALVFFNNSSQFILLFIGSLMLGFILPELWLRQKIKKRHIQIRADLPIVIDTLSLCVGAGLDFMLAVDRIVKNFKRCPLTEELELLWREVQMGAMRRHALETLAKRINMPETHSLIRSLIQAERMGTPLVEVLRVLSEDVRMQRFNRAEELAVKAPIKLLFPLFLFILPSVLVLVAGPIFFQFMKGSIKF